MPWSWIEFYLPLISVWMVDMLHKTEGSPELAGQSTGSHCATAAFGGLLFRSRGGDPRLCRGRVGAEVRSGRHERVDGHSGCALAFSSMSH